MTEDDALEIETDIALILARIEALEWNTRLPETRAALKRYEEQARALCQEPHPHSVPCLIAIAKRSRQIRRQFVENDTAGRNDLAYKYIDHAARFAASALVYLAETEPSRELLPALDALQTGISAPSAPLEFIPIRLRLVRALKKLNNLPIPAIPSEQESNLPIPGTIPAEEIG